MLKKSFYEVWMDRYLQEADETHKALMLLQYIEKFQKEKQEC